MNENINLCEILKDCPKGTKLYSPIFGEVEFLKIRGNNTDNYQIVVITDKNASVFFTAEGKFYRGYNNAECSLFPSKENHDWSKFKAPWYKKDKFDPNKLKPFDKVLVRQKNYTDVPWKVDFYSHKDVYTNGDLFYVCVCSPYRCCIPYNDETKHLVGTTDEAPEYYRYWEE